MIRAHSRRPRVVACRAVARRSDSSRSLLHVTLLHERSDDPAGGALVEEQPFGQRAQAHRPVLDERLEGVALRDGDIVAADAIAIAELIHAHEIGDGRLERDRVAVEGGRWRWQRASTATTLLSLTTIDDAIPRVKRLFLGSLSRAPALVTIGPTPSV